MKKIYSLLFFLIIKFYNISPSIKQNPFTNDELKILVPAITIPIGVLLTVFYKYVDFKKLNPNVALNNREPNKSNNINIIPTPNQIINDKLNQDDNKNINNNNLNKKNEEETLLKIGNDFLEISLTSKHPYLTTAQIAINLYSLFYTTNFMYKVIKSSKNERKKLLKNTSWKEITKNIFIPIAINKVIDKIKK